MRMSMTLLATVTCLTAAGCGEKQPAEPAPAGDLTAAPSEQPTTMPAISGPPPTTVPATPPPPGWEPADDPKVAEFMGLVAPKPATWIEHPPSGMGRVANYTVPGRDGSDAAHLVVYFFGRNLGGDIEGNIERWQNQFRPDEQNNPPEPIVETLEAGGMTVTLVELAGDWMKMGQRWYTKDQLFIAAIVETPEGIVFIRFTGETATVEANRAAFTRMIEGLRREEPRA